MKKISRRDVWIGFSGVIIGVIITIIPSIRFHKSDKSDYWLIDWGKNLSSDVSATAPVERFEHTAFTMAAWEYLESRGDKRAVTQINDVINQNMEKCGLTFDDKEGREMVARTKDVLNILSSNSN